MNNTVFLIGLSGTGKTTAGTALAKALGRPFIDTDLLIEADASQNIAQIFSEGGEESFRRLETRALERALEADGAIVSTGGGIVETPANAGLLRQGQVVWLTAKVPTLSARLAAHADRPLLAGREPADVLSEQLARRAPQYAAFADWVIATDHLSSTEVAAEIRRMIERQKTDPRDALYVTTPGGSYPVKVAAGGLDRLPEELRAISGRGRVWVVSNDRVWPLHGDRIEALCRGAGIEIEAIQIVDGEAHKNLQVVGHVYDWLLGNKVERGDVLVAAGGGVVGDLAGLVASTVLRGIAFVQIPTTVLAMVDSSIGGKTGVDHQAGKNLIGTFYQPRLVLADTTLLRTLPKAERQSGWTEAIKHGVIADATLFDDLKEHAAELTEVAEPATSELIRRAAAVKVRVVSGDEREQGERILLNYGHTIGHALEHWSNYTLRHGEAVAIGMCVAAAIGRRMGTCDHVLEERQREALMRFELPVNVPRVADLEAVLGAARSDKKVRSKRINWVLPTAIGAAAVRDDVPDTVVLDALNELREP